MFTTISVQVLFTAVKSVPSVPSGWFRWWASYCQASTRTRWHARIHGPIMRGGRRDCKLRSTFWGITFSNILWLWSAIFKLLFIGRFVSIFLTVQDNDLDGSELDSSNDEEEWNSDSSRYEDSHTNKEFVLNFWTWTFLYHLNWQSTNQSI